MESKSSITTVEITRPRLPCDFVLYSVAILVFFLKLQHRSRLLSWWDSSQFALALERFNVVEHRPHPPGYPLYILWGKFCEFFVDNPNLSFVFLGLLVSTIAAVLVFKLTREITRNESVAWIATALYAFSPLTMYHELKALTYVFSAFFAILVAWYGWKIISGQDKSHWKITLAVGIMGMIRPYESIFLLPLALWAVSRLGVRKLLIASGAYIALQVLWLVPVALLSGGFNEYLSELASEGGKHKRDIEQLFGRPLARIVRNWREIYYYMRQSFPVWAYFAVLASLIGLFKSRQKGREVLFFMLWGVPALILYSINHVNYAGICLFLSPFLAIMIAFGLSKISSLINKVRIRLGNRFLTGNDLNRILAVVISLHFLVIFFNLDHIYLSKPPREFDPDGFHHNRILAADGYVVVLRDGVQRLSIEEGGAETVLVLTDLNYRVMMYYLPRHTILWTRYLCQNPNVTDGYTMYAHDREDNFITLPSYTHDDLKYWYYELEGTENYAVFTDEMIQNIQGDWVGGLLPASYEGLDEATRTFIIDLSDAWGIYFRFGEFGIITRRMAMKLGLIDESDIPRQE